MTKAEKKALEDALTKAALCFPPYEKPLPTVVCKLGELCAQGWNMRTHDGRVWIDYSWSSTYCHGTGNFPEKTWQRGGSQGSIVMHESKVQALKAARWEVAEWAAARLRAIDIQIEEAIKAEASE
jgi:hypothetical protein